MKLLKSRILSITLAFAVLLSGLMVSDLSGMVAKAADSTARAGLEKSINYLKAMDTSKYQDASVEDLNAAIKVAEDAYAKTDDTDANYVAARETLEAVRAGMLFKNDTSVSNTKAFRVLSNDEVILEMGAGINLGNTLDGNDGLVPGETKWQKTITTKEIIKSMHDAGFNTVRVPVTWGTMIDDNNGYALKEGWLTRVQEVVDYCVEQDMYCIINIHHDGIANHDYRGDNSYAWLNTATDDVDQLYEKFECVWRNIANRFKDYDEHLIFESMNEVTDAHKLQDGQTNDDVNVLNDLNQIFVNVVRSTGSNNAKRWLAFVGRFATAVTTGLVKPQDAYNEQNALMFAAHIYKDNTSTSWSYKNIKATVDGVNNMKTQLSKNDPYDVPMILGEYGVRLYAQEGSATGYNDQERSIYSEMVNKACQVSNCCPVVWDQNCGAEDDIKTATGIFSYWDRENLSAAYKSTIDGMMRGTYVKATEAENGLDMTAIYESYGVSADTAQSDDNKTRSSGIAAQPTITEIEEITVDSKMTLTAGTYTRVDANPLPANTNDVLLWSTDDDSIATVSNGNIHAKCVGTTTIHVYSQSGSLTQDIKVTVKPGEEANATSIVTDQESYKAKVSSATTIKASVLPASSTDVLSFRSSDTSILNVNQTGMVTGVNPGKAYVIITTASGITKTVPVEVSVAFPELQSQVNVAVHLYYQDDVLGYYGTETGPAVAVKGDGTYTATFDIEKDLSAMGKAMGVTNFNNIGSIYLKDLDITDMNIMTSNLNKAKCKMTGVKVNDTAMELNSNAKVKDALGGGKVFDTGNPINAWTKSVVNGITKDGTKVTFDDHPNPTKFEVTFEVSGLEFNEVAEPVYSTGIKATSAQTIKLAKEGDTAEIGVKVEGVSANSTVTFVSSDVSKVDVSTKCVKVDETGVAKATITASSAKGSALISAYTENGYRRYFAVGVGSTAAPSIPNNDGKHVSVEVTPNTGGGSGSTVTDSLSLKKSSVIVAAGKTAKVGFTASKTPTVKSSNKKITAKVSGKNIVITANKKAVKGSTATVTVKAGTKTKKIKVTVQNKAKKVKAAKKSVTIKKKGKTTKATFKVTATNKKKAVADTIKATVKSKKIAKVTKISVKKGKVILTIKGLKKGKATVTLKIGKKKANVKVNVKK